MRDINYDEIEEKCVGFVKYLNKIGLEITMCCEGHDKPYMHKFWISFPAKVKDEHIRTFVDSFPRPFHRYKDGKQIKGKFMKIDFGLSKDGKDEARWRYESGFSNDYKENQRNAKADLEIFKSHLDIEGFIKL